MKIKLYYYHKPRKEWLHVMTLRSVAPALKWLKTLRGKNKRARVEVTPS